MRMPKPIQDYLDRISKALREDNATEHTHRLC